MRRVSVTMLCVFLLTACSNSPAPEVAPGDSRPKSGVTVPETPGRPGPYVVTVEVADGRVVAAGPDRSARVGEQVTVTVESDVADDVHLHGYDLTAPVAPGAPARIRFIAAIPGVFEVELEQAGILLFELTVD